MAEIEIVIRVGKNEKELLAPNEVSVRALLSKAGKLMGEDFLKLFKEGLLIPKRTLSLEDLDRSLENAGFLQRTVITLERPAVEEEEDLIQEKVVAPEVNNVRQIRQN